MENLLSVHAMNVIYCDVHCCWQGVESERCPSFQAALDAGHPVKIQANQSLTLADGE